jgi:hypothetical protein
MPTASKAIWAAFVIFVALAIGLRGTESLLDGSGDDETDDRRRAYSVRGASAERPYTPSRRGLSRRTR